MNRIACVTVLSAVLGSWSAGCGTRTRPVGTDLARLFPRSEVPLLRSRALSVLSRQTLAVAVLPSLRALHLAIDGNAIDGNPGPNLEADIRAAVHEFVAARLGHDVLAVEDMEAMGVDTDAEMALAWLDWDTAAVVLPIDDRARFAASWRGSHTSMRVLGARYAVIAFALGEVLDPSGEAVSELARVAPDSSLATHAGLKAAAARLAYGPDGAVFVNVEALRAALLLHLDAIRDRMDLQTVRDLVDMAELRDDREVVGKALEDLAVAELASRRIEVWRALVADVLEPIQGVAVGIGVERSRIKARLAIELQPDNRLAAGFAAVMTPLPKASHEGRLGALWFAARAPQTALLPALELLLARRAYLRLSHLVAALGGHTALDGTLVVGYRAEAGGLSVRLGLRDAERTRAHVERSRPVAGWRMRVDEGQLMLERRTAGTSRPRGRWRGLAEDARGLFDGASAMALVDWTALRSGRGRAERSQLARLLSHSSDGPLELLGATAKQRADYEDMRKEQAALLRRRAESVAATATTLSDALGVAALSIRAEPEGPMAAVVFALEPGRPSELIASGLRWWYENSQRSPRERRLAELEQRLLDLRITVSRDGLSGLLAGRTAGSGLSTQPASRSGSSGYGTGTGRIGSLSSRSGAAVHGGRTTSRSPSDGLEPTLAKVTVSATRVDATLDRMVLDRWLMHALPRLRGCHERQLKADERVAGYMRAALRVTGAGLRVSALEPAASAENLDRDGMRACVVAALEAARLPGADTETGADAGTGTGADTSTGTGTAEATLWFGMD